MIDFQQIKFILEEGAKIGFLIIKTWWWVLCSIPIYFLAKFFYLWWIRWEVWYKEQEWIMLEVIPPAEIEKPFRAMEDLFAALWPIYDSPNWRERWCQGELTQGPFWFSFEVVSFEGEIHFFLRILKDQKNFFESVIHSHYPEMELVEVEDYTKNVPQDIPNKDYDLYGEDYILLKDDYYPILTYKHFEAQRPEQVPPEKRIDPLYSFLEALSKLKKGEQFWFQAVITPILDQDVPWITEGRKAADRLAKRPSPRKPKSMIGEALNLLFFGKPPFKEEKKEEAIIPPEMKLTPGEREILTAVEQKITKPGFKTTMRALYIYKRDAYNGAHKTIARAYFAHFNSPHLNTIMYWKKTRTRIHYFFRERRLYMRKRNIFRRYIERFPPLYPQMVGEGTMILNSEELATVLHFPTKAAILPPTVPRILARKGAPPTIPTE